IDTSDFISYEIHPLPVRPVIIQHNDTLISTKGFKYQWYDLIYHLISGETNQFFIPPQSGYYHVKVKDSLGCESYYSSSYYFDRCYYFAPPPIFRNKEISFCSGILSPGELATVDKLSFSYQWFRNNKGISNSDSSYFMVSDSGDYKVMVTDSAGCSKFTDVEIMYRIKNPSPTIYQEGNILFTGVAQSYQWYQDGVLLPGETGQFYSPGSDGNYSVEVENEAGCKVKAFYDFKFCK
ncbi:MAG: hypothetical protein IT241_08960, partial [Bacteroidia bacterium]|nr:hypothetical protein [Bacteroidia bacterium]